jgi:hypothetical protein
VIDAFLDDLESRIDETVETNLWNAWRAFYEGGGPARGLFAPRRPKPLPPRIPWPDVPVNEFIADPDRMLYHQFRMVSAALEAGGGHLLCMRCNYSTAILPSLYGTRLYMMDAALNTLPTAEPLAGGVPAIRALVDRGAPDLRAGLGARVFDMADRLMEVLERRPRLRRHVRLFHPDLQGPMDVCELIWGSSIFLGAYDEPDLLHGLLANVTDTYERFMSAWTRYERPEDAPYAPHWCLMVKGRLMLRDDSAMNFSPDMYGEFIAPYDGRLLRQFGGAVHFCGRGDHYLEQLVSLPGLTAVNLSQPAYNDMEKVYSLTVDRGIPLLGFQKKAAETALAAGRDLRGRVHVWG